MHKGKLAQEGHYVCFCRDERGKWWHLNDDAVMEVNENVVRKFMPYLVMYQKL